MKNILKAAIISVFMLSGVMSFAPATSSAATKCDARGVGGTIFTNSTNNTAYKIQGNKATVTFKVSNCDQPLHVTMIAWKAPNGTDGKPYAKQTIFAHTDTSRTFANGTHTMTVDLPDCFFQVDTVTGTKLTGSTGGAHDYNARQVAFMHGGTKSCVAKPPVTPPVTPPATPATPVAQVTALPNTGPVSNMLIGAVVTAIAGGFGYSQLRARRNNA